MSLDNTSPRNFNTSLKKALKEKLNQKVKVEIINSYKFHSHSWVRVYAETTFSNDFRLECFKTTDRDIKDLRDINNISYANIGERFISLYACQWEKMFN